MSELANQHNARKARLQRFAEAAARHVNKGREQADIRQVEMLERYFEKQPKPQLAPVRRQYERIGEPSIGLPIIWRIKRAVADEFGMTVTALVSKQRAAENCLPRYVAIGLMLELTRMSLPAIGRQLGGRDHTTIINGRNRLNELLKSEAFRNRFDQIKASVA